MQKEKAEAEHPYIESVDEICGGSPVVKGTRMRVVDIALEYEYLGRTPDEIIDAHPHLKLEHVHDALSYYYENRRELDEKIESDKEFIQRLSQATETSLRP